MLPAPSCCSFVRMAGQANTRWRVTSHSTRRWRKRYLWCMVFCSTTHESLSPKACRLRRCTRSTRDTKAFCQRVSTSVWWPGVSKDIKNFVKSCPDYPKTTTSPREPLLQSSLLDDPWERVVTDLFELNGTTYLPVMDYYSRYIEVQKLKSTTSASIIVKTVFSHHGIPAEFVSNNGPHYIRLPGDERSHNPSHTSQAVHTIHISKGEAERAVKTAKNLLEHSPDHYLALLSYRTTPLGLSPAELLMGQRLRTDVPQLKKQLVPCWPYVMNFRSLNQKFMASQIMMTDIVSESCLPCWTNYLFGLKVKGNKFLVRSPSKLLLNMYWKYSKWFKLIRRLHRSDKHYINTFPNWHCDQLFHLTWETCGIMTVCSLCKYVYTTLMFVQDS